MKYFFNTITSKAYWQYIFSMAGIRSIFAIFGSCWLIVEILDFFKVYTRDQYVSYSFLIFMGLATIISILIRRPVTSISIAFPQNDFSVGVRIADLFDLNGAAMISTNTIFEADVASGKIATNSLQGQFTARYFLGNQTELIQQIKKALKKNKGDFAIPDGNYNTN